MVMRKSRECDWYGIFDEDTGEMLEIYLLETNQLLDQSDAILLSAEQEMVFSREHQRHLSCDAHHKELFRHDGADGTVSFGPPSGRLICGVSGRETFRLTGYKQETFDLIFEATDFIRGRTETNEI